MELIRLIAHCVKNTAEHSGSNTATVHSVMNTAAHSGSNTDYSEQCYEHSSKSAENDDACQPVTLFMCVLIHHSHLAQHTGIADNTAEPSMVPSVSKLPPPPKPSLNKSVPVKLAL